MRSVAGQAMTGPTQRRWCLGKRSTREGWCLERTRVSCVVLRLCQALKERKGVSSVLLRVVRGAYHFFYWTCNQCSSRQSSASEIFVATLFLRCWVVGGCLRCAPKGLAVCVPLRARSRGHKEGSSGSVGEGKKDALFTEQPTAASDGISLSRRLAITNDAHRRLCTKAPSHSVSQACEAATRRDAPGARSALAFRCRGHLPYRLQWTGMGGQPLVQGASHAALRHSAGRPSLQAKARQRLSHDRAGRARLRESRQWLLQRS